MATKILLTADLHIGLTSSRIGRSHDAREFATAEAWRRIVDLARTEAVKAVLLAGDVVDENNKFFEAIGPLQRGIEDLAEAGIVTIAVSGNHDHDVLRRLASELPLESFRLLGGDGNWERTVIHDGGEPVLHVDGVSFPTAVVQKSALEAYDLERDSSIPTLGIVHGDLYEKASRYRPLELRQLQGIAVDGWLLGHIHAQRLIEGSGSPWVLYPGSPQALDPGEEGPHGPWMAEIDGNVLAPPALRPLSTALYATVDIDLTNVADRETLEGSMTSQIRDQAAETIADAGPALRLAALRCRIHGTTPFANEVDGVATQLKDEFKPEIKTVPAIVDSYTLDVVPPINLDQYSSSNTAPGALARLLRDLDEPEPTAEVRRVVDDALEQLKGADAQPHFTDLEPPPITEQMARDYVRTQARALLAQLVKDEL